VDTSPATSADNFGLQFVGYVEVPTNGVYTFFLESDDGSVLYVDGVEVIDNDGEHGARMRSINLALEAGYHALRVDYFESIGTHVLALEWAGPDIDRQVVPAGRLFH
jgi:hypothetical protein